LKLAHKIYFVVGIFTLPLIGLTIYFVLKGVNKDIDFAAKEMIGNAPLDYRAEWAELLAKPKEALKTGTQSLVIFTVGGEHLALPASVFREVCETQTVHRLPGYNSKILIG